MGLTDYIFMELTQEQINIITSTGDIKINAVAGSGKTTTIIEYARTRPVSSTILYLAFNKSVKLEAIRKFAKYGLENVKVETAHSLAYRYIVPKNGYTVRPQGYKTYEIAELLGLKSDGEKHAEFIIANHVNKFITYFCNSNKQRVHELNYLDLVTDSKAKAFVSGFYPYIETQTRILLGKMDKGETDVTHDFYLKKFQLMNPVLPYDYILFDEAQDASPAMLDIVLSQKAVKVIVGDTHQQIYGWRHAVNSLEKADFRTYRLSNSFRFSQDIADLASEVLSRKSHIATYQPFPITGTGTIGKINTKAVIARTNLGLLLKAIEYISEKKNVKQIYFEGNINSYTYADEGASLYDVLNLYNFKPQLIKDKLIKGMQDMDELENYIEKTEDAQLSMMVEIVKEYGNEIPGIIKKLKEKQVENDEKEKAEMIFSTVHRCKGMEYDSVQLVNDFITEEKLGKLMHGSEVKEINMGKLGEEINLLYVALTRARSSLHIPTDLMPKNFPVTKQIHVLKVEIPADTWSGPIYKNPILKKAKSKVSIEEASNEKTYSVNEIREAHKDAYKPWNQELDDELTVMYCEGINVKDMAKHFGRTKGAIRSRIIKLELPEIYG